MLDRRVIIFDSAPGDNVVIYSTVANNYLEKHFFLMTNWRASEKQHGKKAISNFTALEAVFKFHSACYNHHFIVWIWYWPPNTAFIQQYCSIWISAVTGRAVCMTFRRSPGSSVKGALHIYLIRLPWKHRIKVRGQPFNPTLLVGSDKSNYSFFLKLYCILP